MNLWGPSRCPRGGVPCLQQPGATCQDRLKKNVRLDPRVMSVRFSSPLRTFSPEDRFSPGNGPGRGASEFSASECLGERQTADTGIPDTAKGRRSIFQLREQTGSCSPCLALPAPASQPPESPPASARCACAGSAEMPQSPFLCPSGHGPPVLLLHLEFCLFLSVGISVSLGPCGSPRTCSSVLASLGLSVCPHLYEPISPPFTPSMSPFLFPLRAPQERTTHDREAWGTTCGISALATRKQEPSLQRSPPRELTDGLQEQVNKNKQRSIEAVHCALGIRTKEQWGAGGPSQAERPLSARGHWDRGWSAPRSQSTWASGNDSSMCKGPELGLPDQAAFPGHVSSLGPWSWPVSGNQGPSDSASACLADVLTEVQGTGRGPPHTQER